MPHLPWICDEKYRQPFIDAGYSESLADCWGSIAQMDAAIGRILEALEQTGQADRTIVVFLSDNGPTGPEAKKSRRTDRTVEGTDWAKRNSAGLRGHKATIWENGLRVPLLIGWPGHIPPGPREQFAMVDDILPTVLDLCSIPTDIIPHLPFTDISLTASLEEADNNTERPEAFRIAISGRGAPSDQPHAGGRKMENHHLALRGPRFKFHSLPGGRNALYDLAADPGENADVSDEFPEQAAKMNDQLRDRWNEIIASGRAFAPAPDS
jgi:arylsulfatase A-like enzyme